MRSSQKKKAEGIVTDQDAKFAFNLIWKAAADGDLDMVRILHREGQSLDQQTQFKMNTALHLAVMNKHHLIVRYLVESGASTTIANKGIFIASTATIAGRTALDEAKLVNVTLINNILLGK